MIVNNIKEDIKNNINSIINKFKLSDDDDNKYNKIINESIDIGYKLDKDKIIDKIFDKIMSNFKDNPRPHLDKIKTKDETFKGNDNQKKDNKKGNCKVQ